MTSSHSGKALGLKVRRVLKTNVRGGIGRADIPGDSMIDSVIDPPLPPDPSSGVPNSQTGPGSGSSVYTSRGGTRTKK